MEYRSAQVTPNSLEYFAATYDKNGVMTKSTMGTVRTNRVQDFNFEDLDRFARASVKAELEPVGVKQVNYKGMHCTGNRIPSRRNRKSHAERRAGIVARSQL